MSTGSDVEKMVGRIMMAKDLGILREEQREMMAKDSAIMQEEQSNNLIVRHSVLGDGEDNLVDAFSVQDRTNTKFKTFGTQFIFYGYEIDIAS